MNTGCHIDENDEYSLQDEFSDRIKADKNSVEALMKNVLQRGTLSILNNQGV